MDDLLHCPKCRERFGEDERRPKLLQCHHTYCLRCLQELQSRQGASKKAAKSVTCPTCSKVTSVGKKGVSSLQDNFYITTFRSTLDMQASETESAVDDIYVSDEEDQQAPSEDANDWCKTCKRVAVPSCVTSKHNLCNLLKLIQGLLAQFGDLVLSQLETREPVVHALQSAELGLFAVLHALQEDVSSQDMLLSMARSEKQWLLALDLGSKTTTALADRFGKLDLQVSAAVDQLERARATSNNFLGLRRATLTLDFSTSEDERQAVTLPLDGDTDHEKALRYLLYKMMQAKKLNVPEAKPEDLTHPKVEEEWKVVGGEKTSRKTDTAPPRVPAVSAVVKPADGTHPPVKPLPAAAAVNVPMKLPAATAANLPAGYVRAPQRTNAHTVDQSLSAPMRISVHSVAKAAPALARQPPAGLQQPRAAAESDPASRQAQERTLVVVKSVGPPAHSHQCFFEIEVNGKAIGKVVMKLRPDVAPKMCANFVALCRGELGYGYKGSRIFKVHSNSFVVGGDFEHNDGTGGYSIYNRGYFLGDDCNIHDSCGALRMRGMGTDLKTGGGKVGSQFHIWVGEKEFKEYKKTLVFGHVVKGLEYLQYVSNFKTIRNGDGDFILKSSVTIKNCGTL